jgi:membrane fusion protein (multidrug efflux system)
VLVLALVLGAVFTRQWLSGRGLVSTDNAQVAGHVVPVLARVSGYVTAVNVNENQRARTGDVLVTIDDRDYKVHLAQTEADLEKELASAGTPGRTGEAAAQIGAARATEAQAQANADHARTELKRASALAQTGAISQQELDAARAASLAADAQVAAAHDQIVAAQAGLTGAVARVASARAARDQAALQLSYTTIASPLDGVVSRKNVEIGELVQVGQPLFAVVPLDDVWIVANLKETEIRGVAPGAHVDIAVDSYRGRHFTGHVESLSPATGATFSMLPPDNATGNFTKVVQRIPVRIDLDGPPDPAHPLRPGMSALVRIRVK